MEFFHWPVQFLYQFVVQANSYGQFVNSYSFYLPGTLILWMVPNICNKYCVA